MGCVLNAQTNIYLPKDLTPLTIDLEADYFYYDYTNNILYCKLFLKNPYSSYFKQFYQSIIINEYELTDDILNVVKSYTDSQSNECYTKTNLNLLIASLDHIDWICVNRLRPLIRGLVQSNIKHISGVTTRLAGVGSTQPRIILTL
jgi:hypothetical protein